LILQDNHHGNVMVLYLLSRSDMSEMDTVVCIFIKK